MWAEGRIFGNFPGKLNPQTDTLEKALEYGLIDRIIRPGEDYVAVIREELAKLQEQRIKLIRSRQVVKKIYIV